ncbi:MAG: hypothetical protein ACR2P9_01335 [Gammaproteobacteria bacterium]
MTDINNLPPGVSNVRSGTATGELERIRQEAFDSLSGLSQDGSITSGIAPRADGPGIPLPTPGIANPPDLALPTPGTDGATELQAAKDAMQTIGENAGFDFSRFAELFIKMETTAEKAARQQVVDEMKIVADTRLSSAKKLEDGAALSLTGGIASAAMSIGSAGVNMAGGVKGTQAMSGTGGMGSSGINAASAQSQSIGNTYQGASSAVGGVGQLTGAGFKFGADEEQAESKKIDAEADKLRGMEEQFKAHADSIHKAAQDVQQAFDEADQIRQQTASEAAKFV